MNTLAFEGRITCDNGRDSFEIVGDGAEPFVRVGSIRAARRVAGDFRPLLRRFVGLTARQPVTVHVGPRLRLRLGGGRPTQKRAAILGRVLGLPLTELWYAPRSER